MRTKQYPKVYEQIRQYKTLLVNLWCSEGCIKPENREECIQRFTNTAYRKACKALNTGVYTQEQVIELFPLD